jgi:uncharacterized protein YegP (UPF0339 family)
MGKFVIKATATGFVFHLNAGNGETIGVSEVYTSEKNCLNGIESVKKNAAAAPVEDQTAEGFEKQKNPKFEVYADKKGQIRFRLKASNGEPILASEGYKSKTACLNGIESVKKNAPAADVAEEAK